MLRQTSTYAILEVSAATFADCRRRLRRLGVLDDYLQMEPGHELLVFGEVALAIEPSK